MTRQKLYRSARTAGFLFLGFLAVLTVLTFIGWQTQPMLTIFTVLLLLAIGLMTATTPRRT